MNLLVQKIQIGLFKMNGELLLILIQRQKIKAKAVYLGFDVTAENQERMVRCAKHKGFSLFKMKTPKDTKKIEYDKLV